MKSFVKVREIDEDGESVLLDIPIESVEDIDIEEDFDGKDLATFLYKGKQYKSYIINKH